MRLLLLPSAVAVAAPDDADADADADDVQGQPGTIEGMTEWKVVQLGAAVAALHMLKPVENLPPFPMGSSPHDCHYTSLHH